jgi:hypothetical protein
MSLPSKQETIDAPIKAPIGSSTILLSARSSDGSLLASVYRGREEKWLDMLYGPRSWDSWVRKESEMHILSSHRHRIKKRCRKGIPESVRRSAWIALTSAGKLKAANLGRYRALLALPVHSNSQIDARAWGIGPDAPGAAEARALFPQLRVAPDTSASRSVFDTIEKDVTRTFTRTAFFSDEIGQSKLFRVLFAFANHDQKVGYCQGMAFIAALLISFLGGDEEDAFWVLCSMMHSPLLDLAGLYAPGLPRIGEHLHIVVGLLNTLRPELSASLYENGLHVSMYASQWLMTLFTYSFPLPLVARIFDSFLWEGYKTIYRVTIAVLIAFEKPILAAKGLEEAMAVLKLIPDVLAGNKSNLLPNSNITDTKHLINNGGEGVAKIIGMMPLFDGSENAINDLLESAFSLKIFQRDIAAINLEYESLVSTNCETSTPNAGCILRRGIKDLPEKAQESYIKLKLSASRTTTTSRVQSSTQEERAATPPQRPSIASWGTSSGRH